MRSKRIPRLNRFFFEYLLLGDAPTWIKTEAQYQGHRLEFHPNLAKKGGHFDQKIKITPKKRQAIVA